MTRFPQIALGDICEINPRLPQSHNLLDTTNVSFVPMAAINEEFGDIAVRITRPYSEVRRGYTSFFDHDVLFAKITPCMQNGKAAIARQLCSGVGFGSTEFHVLRPKNTVLPEWIFYFVRQNSFREEARLNFTGTAGHQRVPNSFLQGIQIPLPPLGVQRRLVDLLSRAEGIVRLRREAQRKAAELTPALFLDLFGDPTTNPKGWPVVKLGSYVRIKSSVKIPQLIDDADLPCIGADSIESATGKIVSWPTVDEIRPISGKYAFAQGDVLYSKIRPALRKVIIAPSIGYCSADMYPLQPSSDLATPEFVSSLLLSKGFTDYAIGVSMRAQMPKINRETLFAYEAPLPPIELQRKFAAKADAVRSIVAQQANALTTAQSTFSALLSRSFQH